MINLIIIILMLSALLVIVTTQIFMPFSYSLHYFYLYRQKDGYRSYKDFYLDEECEETYVIRLSIVYWLIVTALELKRIFFYN